jgi:hypothetical protein
VSFMIWRTTILPSRTTGCGLVLATAGMVANR